ncbi:transcription factor, partial [Ascosphaera atra]
MQVNQELVESVIATLGVATVENEPVTIGAMNKYGNYKAQQEQTESVKAYAKIAGREWTYFMKKLSITIGRNGSSGGSPGGHHEASASPVAHERTHSDQSQVDIDLSPVKYVSRIHAEIFYDNMRVEPPCWRVRVVGRNGVRLNNVMLKRGGVARLKCGDVIEVSGTQMMFVTPGEKAVIDQSFIN